MPVNITKKNTSKKNFTTTRSLNFEISKDSILTVQINALSLNHIGLAELPNGYTIMVPNVNLGDQVEVQIQKVLEGKTPYATAKVLKKIQESSIKPESLNQVNKILTVKISKVGPKGSGLARLDNNFILIIPKAKVGDQLEVKITRIKQNYGFAEIVKPNQLSSSGDNSQTQNNNLQIGTKYNIILPSQTKYYSKYALIKIKNKLVFVKMELGAELGKQVKIQLVKVSEKFAVAKIVKIAPLSKNQKQVLVKQSIKEMVDTGLHFGEKAIRCHANMRKFLWFKKKGKYQNRPFLRKGRHIINVLKTRRCLNKSLKQLSKYAAKGNTFLFVGTKKSAAALIARTAMLSQTSFFVNTRWLGGMLTNWKTILKSISQIRPILKEKQRIIKRILEKRQNIKIRLIEKVNLLRQKTTKLMLKGKQLITKIQQNKNEFFAKSQLLLSKKTDVVRKNHLLVKKYSDLILKQQILIQQLYTLQGQTNQFIEQKHNLIIEVEKSQQKLHNLKQLFMIGQELMKIKKASEKNGQLIWAVPYTKFSKLVKQNNTSSWLLPNPSKEILNQIILALKTKDQNQNNELLISNANIAKSEESPPISAQTKEKILVFSKILEKFLNLLPLLEFSFKVISTKIQKIETIIQSINNNLKNINAKSVTIQQLNTSIQRQLEIIEKKFVIQQNLLNNLKIQLKRLSAEQKLLKFLPRLRYLQTPKTKMIETVEILMKKFVDPKMSYPVDQIYDQKLKFTSKKIAATRKQKWQRLEKYFGGVTKMSKMTKKQLSQNIAIIVGQQDELNAVFECQKLGIKMFTIVDTNCNPRLSDHIIPANDDSRNAIKYILGEMLTYIRLAQKLRQKILSRKIQKSSNLRKKRAKIAF